jgi:hypothetical protein
VRATTKPIAPMCVRKHARTDRATYATFGKLGWLGWKVVAIRGSLWARSVRYGVCGHAVPKAERVPQHVGEKQSKSIFTQGAEMMSTYNTCMRCGWNLHTGRGRTRSLHACQAPLCQIYQVIICDECLKAMNPNKGLFGGGVPKKCPACGVGELAYVRLMEK